MGKQDIRRYSLSEIKQMVDKGEYEPTRADAVEYTVPPEFWENCQLVAPKTKKSVHLRLDQDVLEWFKSQGPGHLTRLNAVLRSYYEAHQHKPASA